jgi:hypothetical protein
MQALPPASKLLNSSIMNWNPELKDFSPKTIAFTLAVVLAAAGLVLGGRAYLDHRSSRSMTSEDVRAEVTKYLNQRAGRTHSFHGSELSIQTNLIPTLRAQYENVPDYKTVYRLIAEHLKFAETLLNSAEPREHHAGLRVLMFLSETAALNVAVDEWLAASICEGYIVPNAEKAAPIPRQRGQQRGQERPPERGQELSPEGVIRFVLNIYRQTESRGKQITLYETLLAKAPNPQRADTIRLGLADALEVTGDHKQALVHLREISSSTLTNAAARRISMIERKTAPATTARR